MSYLKITNRRIMPNESDSHLVYKECFPRPELRYDENQPRDDHGRFTSGGGSGAGLTGGGDSGTMGLGSGNGSGLIEPHDPPKHIKKIDITSETEIQEELDSFERIAIQADHELACVITQAGDVYYCFGNKDRVYPDYDLGEKLFGAYVSHNHTESETEYSFSDDDFDLFLTYNLSLLRGVDHKFEYELSSNYSDLPKDDFELSYENAQHYKINQLAKAYGVGYRRYRR